MDGWMDGGGRVAYTHSILSPSPSPWLPDGFSHFFMSYVIGPSGFWTMALLRYAAKFDPSLSLDCAPPPPPPWHNPRKGRDQILPSGYRGRGTGAGVCVCVATTAVGCLGSGVNLTLYPLC